MSGVIDGPLRPVHEEPVEPNSISPAIGHPDANRVMSGSPGTDVKDLECEITSEYGALVTRSRWLPSPEQRAAIQAGATIVLEVSQDPTPPVWVGLEPPRCPECDRAMEVNLELGCFACPHED